MSAIPTISLWQPWASFIAIGVKPYETRHWRPPARFIGQRIGIHAAKRRTERSDFAWWQKVAGPSVPLPEGAIVCTAILRAVFATLDHGEIEDDYGDYSAGRFAWHLTDVQPLIPPVPATGRQGFWSWEPPP